MIIRENGIFKCDTAAEVAFVKSIIALSDAMNVEWKKRTEQLKETFSISCVVYQNRFLTFYPDISKLHQDDWTEVVLRHE